VPIDGSEMRIRIAAIAVASALVTAACGPSVDFDLMVSFEARWMCDVQRSVYEDIDDLTTGFDERLSGNGLTPEVYRDFKEALADDLELRNRVLAEYQAFCDG
jgi:hypothetical protein